MTGIEIICLAVALVSGAAGIACHFSAKYLAAELKQSDR